MAKTCRIAVRLRPPSFLGAPFRASPARELTHANPLLRIEVSSTAKFDRADRKAVTRKCAVQRAVFVDVAEQVPRERLVLRRAKPMPTRRKPSEQRLSHFRGGLLFQCLVENAMCCHRPRSRLKARCAARTSSSLSGGGP